MKEKAKASFISQLTKVGKEEGIDFSLEMVNDGELKQLYQKLQFVRSRCKIGINKDETIEKALQEKTLMRLSFSGYGRYGVRRITFKEYLQLEDYLNEHPDAFQGFSDLLYH